MVRLASSRHVVVLTGAGVSAESGVPTFRDPGEGLWARYRPEDLATPEAFARDPDTVWQWYQWRREKVLAVEPNAGHVALADMQTRFPRFTLITQNVDGLHARAGSTDVIEFHGNLFANLCSRDRRSVSVAWRGTDSPPACPECGAPVRPGVVWFGEAIPRGPGEAAFAAAGDCDAFLSVGTSSLVTPAADLAHVARSNDACVIEINIDATELSHHTDYCLRRPSAEVLPALAKAIAERQATGDSAP